jgi:hypothetical protein
MDYWNWKKFKEKCPKLTFFKVCASFFKSDERSGVINELLIFYLFFNGRP